MSIKKTQFQSIIEELENIKYENISSTGRLYGKFIAGNILYSLITPKNNKEINKKEIKKENTKSTENILDDIINNDKNYKNENYFSNEKIKNISKELQDSIKKYKEKSLIPTLFSSIQGTKKNKKFFPNTRILNYIQKMKKKTPSMCYYEPKYESIDKHIPQYILQPIKKKNNNIEINNNKLKQLFTKNILKKKSLNYLYKSNFIHAMSFDKYSSRPDIMTNKPLGDSYIQIKRNKNISVPNFKKMISREKNIIKKRIDAMRNYSPNYSSIYCDKILLPEINEDLKKKKNLLRKSSVNYNISSEYQVITKLNDN